MTPGVESNTAHRCERCGAIVDLEDVTIANEGCPVCGHGHFIQIAVIPCCDFCSANLGADYWTYPCSDFMYPIITLGADLPDGGSKGNWACCAECHEIFGDDPETSDDARRAGIARAIDLDQKREPGNYHLAYALIKAIHTGFHQHRTGIPWKGDDR